MSSRTGHHSDPNVEGGSWATSLRWWTLRLCFGVIALNLIPAEAHAQTRVVVLQDQTTIWTTGFRGIATVVQSGTILIAIDRRDDWYEVLLPKPSPTLGTSGLIAVTQVKVLTPGETPGERPPAAAAQGRPPASSVPATGVRAFGHIGYGQFTASDSFTAVLGDARAFWFGGGADVRFARRWFVQGALERFQRTGERVFVFEDEVFHLGVADTVTVMPLTVTVGYRSDHPTVAPYVGGGLGLSFFREESEFADASDNVSEQFTSYHVLGGVEWRVGRLLATAFEAQYTHVPNALNGDLATAFDEHNLGGVQFRVKMLVGR